MSEQRYPQLYNKMYELKDLRPGMRLRDVGINECTVTSNDGTTVTLDDGGKLDIASWPDGKVKVIKTRMTTKMEIF